MHSLPSRPDSTGYLGAALAGAAENRLGAHGPGCILPCAHLPERVFVPEEAVPR